MELISSIVKALSMHFPNYVLYAVNNDDLLLVASTNNAPLLPSARIFTAPGMSQELARNGIASMTDLALHRIGDRAALQPLFDSYPLAANSDYYPVLDTRAAQTRFMQRGGADLVNLIKTGIPVTRYLGAADAGDAVTRYTPNPHLTLSDTAFAATLIRDYVLFGRVGAQYGRLSNEAEFYAENMRSGLVTCASVLDQSSWLVSAVGFAQLTLPFLSPSEAEQIWQAVQSAPCRIARSSTQQAWIGLMLALSRHDAANMADIALELLRDPAPEAAPLTRFLLHSAVLGDLLQQRHERARATWQRHQHEAYPQGSQDLVARLYKAHLGLH